MRIRHEAAKLKTEEAEKTKESERIKGEKNKIEVCYRYIIQSVKDLKSSLTASLIALTTIETHSNTDFRQTFSKVTEWKKEILKIKESKMKFDEAVVSVDINPTMINTLNLTYDELVNELSKIQTDVEKADKDRVLYLTHKPIKELAVYPEPFSGKVIEND